MDPTLDNRMIFGGMANLRLAPHVREGRGVAEARAVPSAEGAAPRAEGPSPAPRGFVAGERLTISAAARRAFEESATDGPREDAAAFGGPRDDAARPAPAGSTPPTSGADTSRAARAAQAYGEQAVIDRPLGRGLSA